MDWDIAKSERRCSACDKEFAEEDPFFSALFDTGAEFVRKDYCPACWESTEHEKAPFSFWKTEVPKEDEPKKVFVDDNVIFDFFRRLADEEHIPARRNFRYILALMLMRKKKLKLTDVKHQDGNEYLVLRRSRSKELHRVLDPKLSEEELTQVRDELTQILEAEVV